MTTILFDLDGTLVDSKPGIVASLQYTIMEVFPNLDISNIRFKIGPPIREIMKDAIHNVNETDLSLLASTFRSRYDTEGWKKTTIYPGVSETLATLGQRGVTMHIITNKPRMPTSLMLPCLDLACYFKEVLSLDARTPPFENKIEMAKFLMEKYQIDIASTFLVGDSEEDQIVAEKCKVTFIGIEYGYGRFSRSSKETMKISSFPQLLTLV